MPCEKGLMDSACKNLHSVLLPVIVAAIWLLCYLIILAYDSIKFLVSTPNDCHLRADCCDGSDEYDGKVKCPNTCWEAGKVARERLKMKIATYQQGVTVRNRLVEQAKLAIAKEEAELSKLKNEEKILKGLVEQLQGIYALLFAWYAYHHPIHLSFLISHIP